MVFDTKGRVRRQWQSFRRKHESRPTKGLTGAALEAAVMGLAAADSSLVKIEARA